MDTKVLVELDIPALGEHYDVMLPTIVPVADIIHLLSNNVNDLSITEYVPSGQEFLCYKEKQLIFKMDRTLESYGVQNGDHLAMI